mgnify:CR=1 FL=1
MSLWQRMTMIFRSKANKVLDRAEDPRETLDYSYARQQAAQSLVDLHFTPTVSGFGLLDWGQFDRIVDAGYRYAMEQLDKTGENAIAPYRYG